LIVGLVNLNSTVMAQSISREKSNGKSSVLVIFLFVLFSSSRGLEAFQSQQITQSVFSAELLKANNSKDENLADSLIRANRLFVKMFVNDLISESIRWQLSGKTTESGEAKRLAEKTAVTFDSIFGERNLTIAVRYLNSWSDVQKEKKLAADSLYSLGTSIRGNEQDRDKAVDYYQQALDIYNSIGDERGEGEILGGLGFIYFNSKNFEKALYYYKKALIARVRVDDKQLTGNSLNSIGAIYLNFLPDYEQSLHFLDSAEIVRTEIGDMVNLGRTIQAKASAYDKMNMSDKALLDFRKALEINQVVGDQSRVAEAFMHIGIILNNTAKYSEALDNLDRAFKIYSDLENKPGICEVLTHTGFVYSNLGDYNSAIEKLTAAFKISKEEDDNSGLAGAYNNLGIVFKSAGRLEKAKEYFDNSLRIYEQLVDQLNVISVLSNLGTVYFALNDFSKAADYHKRGLDLSRSIRDRDTEVHCLLNLSNDLLRLGRMDESMSNYQTGLLIARSLNSPELTWKIIAGMAENHKTMGEYEKAVELNDTALKFLDGIRNKIKDDKMKASFLAAERYAFEDIINMLADLHSKYPENGYDLRAFRYAEKSKARAFLDLLTESAAHVGENAQNDLLNSQDVSLEDVQAMCPDKNTVILEYSVGDSSSCLWAITRSSYQLFKLPGIKTLQEQIESFRFALLNPDHSNYDFLANGGYSLYKQLLQPAESFLSKKSKLVIIPDGILNILPFEILLTDNKGIDPAASISNLPFLIKKYPVSYGQSAAVLRTLLSEKSRMRDSDSENKKLLAFGDPVFGNENDTSLIRVQTYKRLEYSGKEIENIASYFKKVNTEIFLRDKATEKNVKKEGELKKFNYIHFATHGFIDESRPEFSGLILTKDNKSEDDGFLQATEIYNLNLNADLVVLSACQTGLGKLVRGEGMVGLTRAFIYAGTPTVLVSLWSVSDLSTATLMGEFYRHLIKEKLSKTDALRKAQLTLLGNEKFAHPFYWAPFVIVGDWR
jgi:CHAT domain-containing protein/Tfp pilus assembly protein PilF